MTKGQRGRPPGAKNKLQPGDPNYDPEKNKPGRKQGKHRIFQFTDQEIVETKYKVLNLLATGVCTTIADACRAISVDPVRLYSWALTDPDFKEAVKAVRQVIADDIEKDLRTHANFIPKMFILKAYRPEFKENAKITVDDSKLSEILAELREAGAKQEETTKVKEE